MNEMLNQIKSNQIKTFSQLQKIVVRATLNQTKEIIVLISAGLFLTLDESL